MKFKANKLTIPVAIGTLNMGDTFIDLDNFNDTDVFMVINKNGYDCNVEFHDGTSTIAVVNLTSGELWAYSPDEEVTQVETREIEYNIN